MVWAGGQVSPAATVVTGKVRSILRVLSRGRMKRRYAGFLQVLVGKPNRPDLSAPGGTIGLSR